MPRGKRLNKLLPVLPENLVRSYIFLTPYFMNAKAALSSVSASRIVDGDSLLRAEQILNIASRIIRL